ncbi:hypothetical protein JCM10213v2_004644 [Rhodosporidiobolus nylandii]
MAANYAYPSFDGTSNSWTAVAPQPYYYGAHQHPHHQVSLLQAAQQQQHAAAAAAYGAYNPAAYAQGHAAPYYPATQAQYVAPVPAEQARSRFAFAHAAAPTQHEQQRSFALPPPAMHAQQHHFGADEYMRGSYDAAPYGHAESASRATLENDYDHPSHSRPPHRSLDEQPQQPITYDLIPNVSTVPPPPPIERSAVPLADLAAEMIWELVRKGYLRSIEMAEAAANAAAAAPAHSAGVIGQPVVRNGPRRSGGAEFGAIGSGRARKLSQDGYDSSASSSPASSMPGTPMGVEAIEDVVARRQRLSDLGLGSFGELDNGGKLAYGHQVRSRATRAGAALSPFPAEPSAGFRQFVKQVLTATLVTPEDIVYAICLVSAIPLDKVIPPTAAEPGQDAQTTSFKAAPFKIFLGALMIANKQLQDNSYRNETFSTVSGIPLPDVNALEAHVLLSLGFDVAIGQHKWAEHLAVVVERSRAGYGNIGEHFAVQDTLERLVRAAIRHSASVTPTSPVLANEPVPVVVQECPSTPLPASTSSLHSVDMDMDGPLESARRATSAAVRPVAQRPALGVTQASQDSPLVGRSRSCRGADFSLFPPMLGPTRARSFGQEVNRAIY